MSWKEGDKTKLMNNSIEELRQSIFKVIDEWELTTGVWITKANYYKNAQAMNLEVDVDLEMPKGIR